ncbi:MAG: hypothetical protein MPJ50_16000 [Pirellulales bacterium]|nr:hypothetical protein [Pirellulales bacterium]
MNAQDTASRIYRRALRRKLALVVAVLLLGIVIVLLILYTPNEIDEVEFVLPDGYTGPVIVRQSPDGQSVVKDDARGRIILRVSASGHCEVSDVTKLESWHAIHVHYEDGTPIKVRQLAAQPPQEFGWWEGFDVQPSELVSFVGTHEEAKVYFGSR